MLRIEPAFQRHTVRTGCMAVFRHFASVRLARSGIRPAPGVAPHRVIRTLEPFTQQQIVDPCHPQPITPLTGSFLHADPPLLLR